MIYALIRNGVIVNRIMADANFIALIQSQWDFCVRVDELDPQPQIGWLYDGSNFSEPTP